MATKIGTFSAVLTANTIQFERALNRAGAQVRGFVKRMAILGGALLGVREAFEAVSRSIQLAADLEQTTVAFETLLGSADAARKMIEDLRAFAATTPFQFEGLAASARQMLAFGFAAKDVMPMIRAVGDAVAALGGGQAEIERVIRALGQMRAKGKVSAEEMLQLAELGIPAWEMLAKAIGVDIPTAMKMAQQGAIDAATGINAILVGMQERFAGAMEKQSQTLAGVWSTFKDNMAQLLTTIGQGIAKAFDLTAVVRWFTSVVQWTGTLIENWRLTWEIIKTSAAMQLLAMWDRIKWLGQAIVDTLLWVGRNWRTIFKDVANAVITIFLNLAKNVREIFSEIWDYVTSLGKDAIDIQLTPLLEGFKAQTEKLQLPEFVESEAVGQLRERLGELTQQLAELHAQRLKGVEAAKIEAAQLKKVDPAKAVKEVQQQAAKETSKGEKKAKESGAEKVQREMLSLPQRLAKTAMLGTAEAVRAAFGKRREQVQVQIAKNTNEMADGIKRIAEILASDRQTIKLDVMSIPV